MTVLTKYSFILILGLRTTAEYNLSVDITHSVKKVLCRISSHLFRLLHGKLHIYQFRLFGHMARYPEADPAFRIISERKKSEWRSS